jgi:hypothetical protein
VLEAQEWIPEECIEAQEQILEKWILKVGIEAANMI